MAASFGRAYTAVNRAAIVIGGLVLLGAAIYVVQDLLRSEEDRVREAVHGVLNTVQNGDFLGLDDYLAVDYRDRWGLDRQSAKRLVIWLHRQFSEMRIDHSEMAVKVQGDEATATFEATAKFRAEPSGSWLPLEEARKRMGGAANLRDSRFKLKLVRRDGEWKIAWAGRPGDL